MYDILDGLTAKKKKKNASKRKYRPERITCKKNWFSPNPFQELEPGLVWFDIKGYLWYSIIIFFLFYACTTITIINSYDLQSQRQFYLPHIFFLPPVQTFIHVLSCLLSSFRHDRIYFLKFFVFCLCLASNQILRVFLLF